MDSVKYKNSLTTKKINERLEKNNRSVTCVGDVFNTTTKTLWECLDCNHQWNATPHNVLYRRTNCPNCSPTKRLSNKEIDRRLQGRNIKRIGEYKNHRIPIEFLCLWCNKAWLASPHSVTKQPSGCPRCSHNRQLTNEIVDKKLVGRNIMRMGQVNGNATKIEWCCSMCNYNWFAAPADILNKKSGCPQCARRPYSRKAIKWLDSLMKHQEYFIQHAENGGEYIVPGTRYKVDGFCKKTNTIYEFYGGKFHGNLKIFSPKDKCHPFEKDITAQELFERTIERENIIKSKGYNIITRWESE